MRDLLELYTTLVRAVPELVLILLLYFAGTDLINRLLEAFGYQRIDINGLVAGICVLVSCRAPIRPRSYAARFSRSLRDRSKRRGPTAWLPA